ncbi:hypothetical protein [Gracilimonas sp.]|uniref:hypothetical protein n=1 Tax=Gracilimonas sp. TaxID=1974203 RepID=UPI002870BC06|nr:hypothetical protein [Gracilimonas sp.]
MSKKSKKKLSEASVTDFITDFVRNIQMKSQDRFIQRAKKKGVPKEVTDKMEKVEKEVKELEDFLDEL